MVAIYGSAGDDWARSRCPTHPDLTGWVLFPAINTSFLFFTFFQSSDLPGVSATFVFALSVCCLAQGVSNQGIRTLCAKRRTRALGFAEITARAYLKRARAWRRPSFPWQEFRSLQSILQLEARANSSIRVPYQSATVYHSPSCCAKKKNCCFISLFS